MGDIASVKERKKKIMQIIAICFFSLDLSLNTHILKYKWSFHSMHKLSYFLNVCCQIVLSFKYKKESIQNFLKNI